MVNGNGSEENNHHNMEASKMTELSKEEVEMLTVPFGDQNVPLSVINEADSTIGVSSNKIDMSKALDMTERTDLLIAAMARAKVELGGASVVKDAKNPHFKSDYATLDATLDFFTVAYAKQGVTLSHFPYRSGEREVVLGSLLAHSSGQKIWSTYPLKWDDNPQERGSDLTYAKRYTTQSIVGIAPSDDDDGNQAAGKKSIRPAMDTSWADYYASKIRNSDITQLNGLMAEYICHGNDLEFTKENHEGIFNELKAVNASAVNHTVEVLKPVLGAYRERFAYDHNLAVVGVLKSMMALDADAKTRSQIILNFFTKNPSDLSQTDKINAAKDELRELFSEAEIDVDTIKKVFPELQLSDPEDKGPTPTSTRKRSSKKPAEGGSND